MTSHDLKSIFETQIAESVGDLYFILIESTHKLIQRHPVDKLQDLAFLLSGFDHTGFSTNNIPQFQKL
jgi:hypothetical protein